MASPFSFHSRLRCWLLSFPQNLLLRVLKLLHPYGFQYPALDAVSKVYTTHFWNVALAKKLVNLTSQTRGFCCRPQQDTPTRYALSGQSLSTQKTRSGYSRKSPFLLSLNLPRSQFFVILIWHKIVFSFLQIVAEKQKFRKTPFNYAQKKSHLMRSKVCEGQVFCTFQPRFYMSC